MFTALYVPTFNDYSDPERLVALAQAAEAAGFDGFFLWDHVVLIPGGATALLDATVMLGALAQATRRLRLGAMVTPLARRRPWKFAKEMATLDHLSRGRMTCGVGLGEPAAVDFAPFGEDATPLGRAQRLDEGLALLDPLLRGQSVTHTGNYYQVQEAQLAPACVQHPRMPIWVAAVQPARAGFRRAARWEGCFPLKFPAAGLDPAAGPIDWTQWWLGPDEFAATVAQVRGLRAEAETAFDFVASGRILGEPTGGDTLATYRAAGATWWFEWIPEASGTYAQTLEKVRRGPPPKSATVGATEALRDALARLHLEVDRAADGDRASLATLQGLVTEVERELAATTTPASGLQGLRTKLAELEFAHPRATAIINELSMMLSNLGI